MIRDVVRIINPYEAGKSAEYLKKDYIVLCSNENPYPPHPAVIDAIKEELNNVNRYPDPEYRELKIAVAEYLNVDVDQIVVGNGASEILSNICIAVLDVMDSVTIPIPSYTMYAILAMLRDASINFVEYPYYRINAEDLIEKLRNSKLLFLCSPNNPTGNVIENLEYILNNFNGLIVLDEAYAEFSKSSAIELVDDYENLIIVRTFSKFFGLAGLRIGYAVSKNLELVKALEKIRLPFCINNIAVKAAIAALENIEYYRKIRDKIIEEREKLSKKLEKFEQLEVFPSEANFLLVRVKEEIGLAKKLEKEGIAVRDVTGLMGLKGEHVRITIGKEEENEALIDALKRILE